MKKLLFVVALLILASFVNSGLAQNYVQPSTVYYLQPAAPVAMAAPAPAAAPAGVTSEEMAAIQGLNAFRARCGLPPCMVDPSLCAAARRHSQNMAAYRFFSHVTPWGESHASRGASAENIYMGSGSGAAANAAWINSSGHRANMMGPYTRVGVGAVGGYFTQMFR